MLITDQNALFLQIPSPYLDVNNCIFMTIYILHIGTQYIFPFAQFLFYIFYKMYVPCTIHTISD